MPGSCPSSPAYSLRVPAPGLPEADTGAGTHARSQRCCEPRPPLLEADTFAALWSAYAAPRLRVTAPGCRRPTRLRHQLTDPGLVVASHAPVAGGHANIPVAERIWPRTWLLRVRPPGCCEPRPPLPEADTSPRSGDVEQDVASHDLRYRRPTPVIGWQSRLPPAGCELRPPLPEADSVRGCVRRWTASYCESRPPLPEADTWAASPVSIERGRLRVTTHVAGGRHKPELFVAGELFKLRVTTPVAGGRHLQRSSA